MVDVLNPLKQNSHSLGTDSKGGKGLRQCQDKTHSKNPKNLPSDHQCI